MYLSCLAPSNCTPAQTWPLIATPSDMTQAGQEICVGLQTDQQEAQDEIAEIRVLMLQRKTQPGTASKRIRSP